MISTAEWTLQWRDDDSLCAPCKNMCPLDTLSFSRIHGDMYLSVPLSTRDLRISGQPFSYRCVDVLVWKLGCASVGADFGKKIGRRWRKRCMLRAHCMPRAQPHVRVRLLVAHALDAEPAGAQSCIVFNATSGTWRLGLKDVGARHHLLACDAQNESDHVLRSPRTTERAAVLAREDCILGRIATQD
jgi:hypothetical protein